MKKTLLCFLLALTSLCGAYAQQMTDTEISEPHKTPYEIDLKTNLLYDAAATINLGIELGLGGRWSFDLSGNYNGWTLPQERKWKHWMVQPEFRFYTKTRQDGHFVGIHALGGVYNVNRVRLPFNLYPQIASNRYEGWGAGAGFTYGYRWNFSERCGIEGQVGVGYIYSEYDKFCPDNCGVRIGTGTRHYFGPTKIALNFILRFGKKKREAARRSAMQSIPVPVPVTERIVRDTVEIRDTVIVRDTVETAAVRYGMRKYTLNLQYNVGDDRISENLGDNKRCLDAFIDFIGSIENNEDVAINRVTLTGYSSIEGTAQYNDRLSSARARNVCNYLLDIYPWMEDIITSEGRGEDWAGLLRLVNESDSVWKSDIERIILNTGINDGRERKLMELYGGKPYRWMYSELFPELRRIECTIEFTEKLQPEH